MILSFPDVIGEYIEAPRRFAHNGLQYVGYIEPNTVAPGEVANLFIFLQSTINVPLTAQISLDLPKSGGFFGGGNVVVEVEATEFEFRLERAEVGLLTVPMMVLENTKAKDYTITINVAVKAESRAERVRPEKSSTTLASDLLDSPIGLNVIGALGANFVEKSSTKAEVALVVSGRAVEAEEVSLSHGYQTMYTDKDGEIYSRASQELALRRVNFHKEITAESLYISLFGASSVRFADAGMALRLGEAIVLAKILTYTSLYFLDEPNHYNGLMLPIWERALEADYDTTDPIDVICKVGYYHLLRLAVALSFGIIAQQTGEQHWSLEERQAVTGFIADNLETGQPLEVDFLYLPLLIAGASIAGELPMEGETIEESKQLLLSAQKKRPDLFAEPDMEQAKKLFLAFIKA